ncbi:hypothetical protein NB703_004617 [Pantoea ananatis]|uniref:Uncharacterized protein n=1 Tax=Pantoea ananas TaxID=553 RepID=A0AAJ1D3F6_PANAN|nr:hypothetical protein [Pantoea ananatis]
MISVDVFTCIANNISDMIVCETVNHHSALTPAHHQTVIEQFF